MGPAQKYKSERIYVGLKSIDNVLFLASFHSFISDFERMHIKWFFYIDNFSVVLKWIELKKLNHHGQEAAYPFRLILIFDIVESHLEPDRWTLPVSLWPGGM